MSTPADSVIQHWNRSFRGWSKEYIKPFKSNIIANCLFRTSELEQGHSSALREIEKNKGNIRSFVLEHTEEKYMEMLPSKMLSDAYQFNASDYSMVYRATLDTLISWKPGTSNALSQVPLEIEYGNESFVCRMRKYQLESMKKFIQATPGTKEIKGQWSANVANDAMMISFGLHDEVVALVRIGCFDDKLNIMYDENGVLRKNSKIRKQTLKTSCWGLEKTRCSSKFENSLIIQENYGCNITADDVLSISPITLYAKTHLLAHQVLQLNQRQIRLDKPPFEIQNIKIPKLSHKEEDALRIKYRNTLLHGKSNKTKTVIKKEKKHTNDDDGFCPIKSGNNNAPSASPLSIHSENMELFNPFAFDFAAPLQHPMQSDPFATHNAYSPYVDPWDNIGMSMGMGCDMSGAMNEPMAMDEMNEVQRLRHENELLLQRVTDQQRQIEYLAAQIETMHSTTQQSEFTVYHPQSHNPLKRRRITVDSLLPPAA
eukprot:170792_1